MWMMLQGKEPVDYVIGTGEAHSVEEFVQIAFSHVGLDWQRHVVIDPEFYRPAEVDLLLADPSKARRELGWQPEMSFSDLVKHMVESDLSLLSEQGRVSARIASQAA
jgi:GDPmannose 4,6-dehydratase